MNLDLICFIIPKPQEVTVTSPSATTRDIDNNFSTKYLKSDMYGRNEGLYSDFLAKKEDKEIVGDNLYFFASDRKGDLDIYYYSPKLGIREFFGNKKGSNERYFSYDYKRNVLYFASDRDGKYDIYKYENKTGNFNFQDVFNNTNLSKDIVKADKINSQNNDTCPVVIGDFMVFATDRVGTKGGYDIYLSNYGYGNNIEKWSKPKNIQDLIDYYYETKGSNIPELRS